MPMTNNPILKRREDESLDDFHIRIYSNMYDYGINKFQAADVVNEANGTSFDESKWRKDFAQYLKWQSYLINKNLDDEIVRKHQEIERESEKKKIQFQDQKREYRKYLRIDARLDHVLDTVTNEVKNLNKSKPLQWFKKNEYSNFTNLDGVLLLSDWHKGLFTMNYWNNFDDKEFHKRINKLTNDVVKYGKFHGIKTLHLFQIGDLIHGTIHRLTRIMDTEDAIRSTMSVAETLSEMTSIFANEFEQVRVYSARGNHERVSANKNDEVPTESFNDLIPWFMAERLNKFDNVELVKNEVDGEIIVAEILGNTVFAVHGHRDRLATIVSDLTLMIKKFPKYIFSAHIHKNYENEVHSIEHIVNNCLSGVDDYAKDIRKTSNAAQKFMIFSEKGRLCTYSIQLGE